MLGTFGKILPVALMVAASFVVTTPAFSQHPQAEWSRLVENSKGKSLTINYQGGAGYDDVIDTFVEKFSVNVRRSAARVSQTLSRVRTEQQNNRFNEDIFWGPTSNMARIASPAGMLEPLEKMLVLPEVRDESNWRSADAMWADEKRSVFMFTASRGYSVFFNKQALPKGTEIRSADDLLDPRLRGKIAVRDSSTVNIGSAAITSIYKAKGEAFLHKLLTAQDPQIFENPQQITTSILAGGHAIAIGIQNSVWSQCRMDGGCMDVEPMMDVTFALPLSISVFKQPPNADVAKLFINWFLSKEGQEVFVKSWAKHNSEGAVSSRKDVAPAPKHEQYQVNYEDKTMYWAGPAMDKELEDSAIKLFRELKK